MIYLRTSSIVKHCYRYLPAYTISYLYSNQNSDLPKILALLITIELPFPKHLAHCTNMKVLSMVFSDFFIFVKNRDRCVCVWKYMMIAYLQSLQLYLQVYYDTNRNLVGTF